MVQVYGGPQMHPNVRAQRYGQDRYGRSGFYDIYDAFWLIGSILPQPYNPRNNYNDWWYSRRWAPRIWRWWL